MCQSQNAHQCPPRPSLSSLTALVTAHATGQTSQSEITHLRGRNNQISDVDNGTVDADMNQLAWNGVYTGLCGTTGGIGEALRGRMLNGTGVQAPGRRASPLQSSAAACAPCFAPPAAR